MSNPKSRRGEKKSQKQSACKANARKTRVRNNGSKPSISRSNNPSRTSTEVQVRADSRAAPAWLASAVNLLL